MKYEKSCGAVIFRKTDVWNVLLIRHNKGRHVSFPKGHVEPGETESQTAEREIREETGLTVRVDRRFRAENRYNIRPDTQKLVVIFAAVTDQEEITPQPEEIAEAVWVPVEEAAERLTYERDRRIMRDAFEHVQNAASGRHGRR
ncbi:MAG: NUDIX domain-containing protein [Clostridia bacterium]|nr:NUDIX domain-containing protein [Clostridia bacterium]